jgi:hypothetical protein
MPVELNSVTPLFNYGAQTAAYATQYKTQLAFAQTHTQIIALAQKDKTQLADAQKLAPELAVLQTNPALFTKLATFTDPSTIPPKLLNQAIAVAGGGAVGLAMLQSISANMMRSPAGSRSPWNCSVAPSAPQLIALSKVPPSARLPRAWDGCAVGWRHRGRRPGNGSASAGSCFPAEHPLARRWFPGARKDEAEHEAKGTPTEALKV